MPSGSAYGKLIKECFSAPQGWLFVGADFNSLEDYISALTTKDPNKLDVYIKGYDGHCLRAYNYWKEKMPDIENTVESVNSIKHKYPELRQASKAPTFALTYQGTHTTLMKNCGFSLDEAVAIENAYHKMYEVSDKWVASKLQKACEEGYVEVAFGLRVRTPLLKKSILHTRYTLKQAEAEGRTAGNALGQSYGLLNNRAIVAFMQRVWDSPYRYDIMPVSLIHDAIYLMIKDDIDVLHFVNKYLIKEMQWQELPEIQHDIVKIGAELDVYYPNWANPITLKNDMTKEEILKKCLGEVE